MIGHLLYKVLFSPFKTPTGSEPEVKTYQLLFYRKLRLIAVIFLYHTCTVRKF